MRRAARRRRRTSRAGRARSGNGLRAAWRRGSGACHQERHPARTRTPGWPSPSPPVPASPRCRAARSRPRPDSRARAARRRARLRRPRGVPSSRCEGNGCGGLQIGARCAAPRSASLTAGLPPPYLRPESGLSFSRRWEDGMAGRKTLALVVALAAALLATLAATAEAHSSESAYKVGIIYSRTGLLASYGDQYVE